MKLCHLFDFQLFISLKMRRIDFFLNIKNRQVRKSLKVVRLSDPYQLSLIHYHLLFETLTKIDWILTIVSSIFITTNHELFQDSIRNINDIFLHNSSARITMKKEKKLFPFWKDSENSTWHHICITSVRYKWVGWRISCISIFILITDVRCIILYVKEERGGERWT